MSFYSSLLFLPLVCFNSLHITHVTACLTFILQKLASIFSCSTSFLAWPTLMVLFTGVSPFILATNTATIRLRGFHLDGKTFCKIVDPVILQTQYLSLTKCISKIGCNKLKFLVHTARFIDSKISFLVPHSMWLIKFNYMCELRVLRRLRYIALICNIW